MDESAQLVSSSVRPRRNWRALSLRSLLVLFTLLAIWVGVIANRAREQRRIVNALSQYPNAMIMYDYQWDLSAGGEIPKPRPLSPPPGPLWVRSRLGDEYFVTVIGLFLTGDWNRASDPPLREALETIGELPNLRVLSLEGLPITDAELGAVAGQTNLTYLWLDETPISDAGLVHLRRMRKLKYLYLRQSNVTDAGIDALKRELPDTRICYGRGSPEKIK